MAVLNDCPIIKISKETSVKRNVVLELGGTGIGNSEVLGIKMLKYTFEHSMYKRYLYLAFEEMQVWSLFF